MLSRLHEDDEVCYLCSDNIFVTIAASVLWLTLLGWLFCALAIVADDYLCASLEKITKYCQVLCHLHPAHRPRLAFIVLSPLQVPQNVGTAVFLAFGSAVPEIMTSIVSVANGKVATNFPAHPLLPLTFLSPPHHLSILFGPKVDASLPAILGSGCIAYAVIPPVCVLCIQPFFMKNADRLHAPEVAYLTYAYLYLYDMHRGRLSHLF